MQQQACQALNHLQKEKVALEVTWRRGAKKCVSFSSKEQQLRDFRDTKLLIFGANADKGTEGVSTVVAQHALTEHDQSSPTY